MRLRYGIAVIILSCLFYTGLLNAQSGENKILLIRDNSPDCGTLFPDVSAHYQGDVSDPGGVMPCLKTLIFGPRIGLEANEGVPISFVEKANIFLPIAPFQAFSKTGIKGFFASAFIGPRVGMQMNQRKIRTKEWLCLLPVVAVAAHLAVSDKPSTPTIMIEIAAAAFISRLLPAIDAFRGKTMRDIEQQENLHR